MTSSYNWLKTTMMVSDLTQQNTVFSGCKLFPGINIIAAFILNTTLPACRQSGAPLFISWYWHIFFACSGTRTEIFVGRSKRVRRVIGGVPQSVITALLLACEQCGWRKSGKGLVICNLLHLFFHIFSWSPPECNGVFDFHPFFTTCAPHGAVTTGCACFWCTAYSHRSFMLCEGR